MLFEVFNTFVKKESLQDKTLLLLVSGGVDSMTMLDVASRCHDVKKLQVLHFNHQTREGNKTDEDLVQKICSRLGITCTLHTLEKQDNPRNIEAHWRSERQKKAQDLSHKIGADRILTAHHATDLAETMLFRLVKGCGPGGLSPFDTSTKPFWQIPKEILVKYAQDHHLSWNEDPTNNDEHHQRNIIRNNVLPELRKITPNLEKVFVNESVIFGEVEEYLNKPIPNPSLVREGNLCPPDKGDCPQNCLILREFLDLPKVLQRQRLRSLTKASPSFDEMEDFFRWIEHDPKGQSEKELGKTRFKMEKGMIKKVVDA